VAIALLAVAVGACGSSAATVVYATSNLSGLAARGSHFSTVSATWRQPTIESSAVGVIPTSYHFWVGFGDVDIGPRAEIGTGSRLERKATVCAAWYDMFPNHSVPIRMVIRPGDLMTASVTSRGNGVFVLALSDRTSSHSFTTERSDALASRDWAEIVADWPSFKQARRPPASASVQFTECLVDGRPIGRFNPLSIDLAGELLDAAPSDLGSDQASFSVALMPVSSP
jgi:hypothetical protein